MLEAVQIVAAVLIGLAAAMGVAHVLELPGKLRLTEEQYRVVQPIYYPGFTIGGFIGEFGGMIVTAILVVVTPIGSAGFWPTVGALAAFLAMHGTYWVITHPVNRFWLVDQPVRAAGSAFFRFGTGPRSQRDWRDLRNRWEMSHVIRAALALVALALLFVAIART